MRSMYQKTTTCVTTMQNKTHTRVNRNTSRKHEIHVFLENYELRTKFATFASERVRVAILVRNSDHM